MLNCLKIVASINKGTRKKHELEFYGKYSVFVFRSLRKPVFQNFVNWILKREKIEKKKIKSIQVRMFPFIKKNGNSLAGKCKTEKGDIFLYPKKRKLLQKIKTEMNFKGLLKYLQGRARAALIHELLHLKYKNDEKKVRELAKKYYSVYYKKNNLNPLVFKQHEKRIFKY